MVAQLARVRQLTQGDFSASLKDGRMSVRIRQEDKSRRGEWVLTWFDDGYPTITNDMGMTLICCLGVALYALRKFVYPQESPDMVMILFSLILLFPIVVFILLYCWGLSAYPYQPWIKSK